MARSSVLSVLQETPRSAMRSLPLTASGQRASRPTRTPPSLERKCDWKTRDWSLGVMEFAVKTTLQYSNTPVRSRHPFGHRRLRVLQRLADDVHDGRPVVR